VVTSYDGELTKLLFRLQRYRCHIDTRSHRFLQAQNTNKLALFGVRYAAVDPYRPETLEEFPLPKVLAEP
jgi:hypothetical protein